MGRAFVRVTGVAMVLGALAMPAAAQAQAPSYGGGRLPASAPRGSFVPTVGIVLQPRGDRIAFRFDTSIKCGREFYEAVGRKVVPFDGRSFRARGASRFRIGTRRGNRVIFAWSLRGQADGTIASGRLVIAGVRYVNGRRTRCVRKPRRRFSARISGGAPAGSPAPPAKAAFGGLSDIPISGGLNGSVVLKVGSTGKRIRSRWYVSAPCGRGPSTNFVNFTPPMGIRPDGSFSRAERFSFSYADVFIRYRVRFAGRVSGELTTGTLRMRARIYSPNGKRLLTRCDSGVHNWSAGMLRPIAPAG